MIFTLDQIKTAFFRTYPPNVGNFDLARDFSSFNVESIQITNDMVSRHYSVFEGYLMGNINNKI